MAAWGFAASANAQELPTMAPEVIDLAAPSSSQGLPQGLSLGSDSLLDHDTSYSAPPAPPASLGIGTPYAEPPQPVASPTPIEQPFRPLAPIPSPLMDDLSLDCNYPVVTESTGTWLRRGLWYADLEAIIMTRTWNNNDVTLIGEGEIGGTGATGNAFLIKGEIGESSPGWDGLPRVTIGRFLFRDQKNRDHTAEMAVFGGSEWNEEVSIKAATANGLFVPISLHQNRNNFSGADESNFIYSSRFHSWEWNYQVNERMGKDRMELQPTGEWVRKASPGLTHQYLAGLRYFDLEENVDWFANDIIANSSVINSDGVYRTRASNNMFGFQLGYGITYEADRWNISTGAKLGAYINDARTTSNLAFTSDTNTAASQSNFATSAHENTASYFSQWNITARYHLRPNLSLRFGWEGLYVTSAVLAPNQLNFDPVSTSISVTGDVFYNGITFGTEYYW